MGSTKESGWDPKGSRVACPVWQIGLLVSSIMEGEQQGDINESDEKKGISVIVSRDGRTHEAGGPNT